MGWRKKGKGRNLPGPIRADPSTLQTLSTQLICSGNISLEMDQFFGSKATKEVGQTNLCLEPRMEVHRYGNVTILSVLLVFSPPEA